MELAAQGVRWSLSLEVLQSRGVVARMGTVSGYGGLGWAGVGPDDLKDLFQPKWFYNSIL